MSRGKKEGLSTLVLDSEGLAALGRDDKRLTAWLVRARTQRARVVVPAVVLAEVLQGTARDAGVSRVLKRLHIEGVTEDDCRAAGALMCWATMQGHTVDALVATIARRVSGPVIVLTSDPEDLSRLTDEAPDIGVVRV